MNPLSVLWTAFTAETASVYIYVAVLLLFAFLFARFVSGLV